MSSDPAIQELRALVGLITKSLDSIESTVSARKESWPSPSEPFTRESEAVRNLPEVAAASDVLISAAEQLIASVRSPAYGVLTTAMQSQVTAALGATIGLHVPEILREAGPKGLSAKEIAAFTQVDPYRLARIMRILAAHHIYIETSPDVFVYNRTSSILDSGKSVAAILQDPISKHDGTLGISALFESMIDDGLKSSAYLYESLVDERTKTSEKASDAAFSLAYNTTDITYFEMLHRPGNEYKRKRFDVAMLSAQVLIPNDLIFQGFDWAALPAGSVIVDVGGGVGSQTLVLAKAFSHLNFVVQDLEKTVEQGKQYFQEKLPDALTSGQVKFQAHDFFKPQPVQGPTIFLLRRILHDWSEGESIKILRQLRAAASPDTQLMIVETVVSYVCQEPPSEIPGAALAAPPAPLLPNGGYSQCADYMIDVHMLSMFNGEERTLLRWQKLLAESGWKLARVHRVKSVQSKIIAKPVF